MTSIRSSEPAACSGSSSRACPVRWMGQSPVLARALELPLILAALLASPLAQADAMTKSEYKMARTRISADYKADKAACAPSTANARDICIEQAKGKEKLARAELEYGYSASARNENQVLVVKAETAYAVARERCDDLTNGARTRCVQEAKAIESAALAEAKLGKQVKAGITEAAKDMRGAPPAPAPAKAAP